MDDAYIPFDPWLGDVWSVTDPLGNEWVTLPLDLPEDPATGEKVEGHPFWSEPQTNETEITFVNMGELTTGPDHVVGAGIIDSETVEDFSEASGTDAEKLRLISFADRGNLTQDELFLKLGENCYAVTSDEKDCATVSYSDGLIIFTDEDGDGVIDRIDNVTFAGVHNSWHVPGAEEVEL